MVQDFWKRFLFPNWDFPNTCWDEGDNPAIIKMSINLVVPEEPLFAIILPDGIHHDIVKKIEIHFNECRDILIKNAKMLQIKNPRSFKVRWLFDDFYEEKSYLVTSKEELELRGNAKKQEEVKVEEIEKRVVESIDYFPLYYAPPLNRNIPSDFQETDPQTFFSHYKQLPSLCFNCCSSKHTAPQCPEVCCLLYLLNNTQHVTAKRQEQNTTKQGLI